MIQNIGANDLAIINYNISVISFSFFNNLLI